MNTASNIEGSTLTKEDFDKVIEFLCPKLYYCFSDFIKPGEIIHCKETDLSPEYIVMNQCDFEQVKKFTIKTRTLAHASTYVPVFKLRIPNLEQMDEIP